MDDFLGAAFYRNTTSKCVYRLSSAEAFYKHNVNAALHQSERSEEGRGGKRREEEGGGRGGKSCSGVNSGSWTGNEAIFSFSLVLMTFSQFTLLQHQS